jgi:hypothetical protein
VRRVCCFNSVDIASHVPSVSQVAGAGTEEHPRSHYTRYIDFGHRGVVGCIEDLMYSMYYVLHVVYIFWGGHCVSPISTLVGVSIVNTYIVIP